MAEAKRSQGEWELASIGPPRPEEDRGFAGLVVQLVATALGMEPRTIVAPGRDPRAVRARQIAMYLAHTGLDWTMARTGAAFGRDKSTVSHACGRVEDFREDPAFDKGLTTLERWLRSLAADRVRM